MFSTYLGQALRSQNEKSVERELGSTDFLQLDLALFPVHIADGPESAHHWALVVCVCDVYMLVLRKCIIVVSWLCIYIAGCCILLMCRRLI